MTDDAWNPLPESADERFMLMEAQRIARVGSYIWDLVTGEVRWSDECYRLFGVSRETFATTVDSVLERVHPADKRSAEEWIRAHTAGSEPYPISYRAIWPDGSAHWLFTDGKLYRDADGEPVRMVGIIRDISQRKPADSDLRESRERLQAILDQSTSLVYVVDLDGRFTFANRQLVAAIGLPMDAIIGKSRDELLSPDTAAQHRANDLEVIRSGRPVTREETNTQTDGLRTYLSVKFPLFDSSGEIVAVCGMSTDITANKRAEQAFRESEERFSGVFHTSPAAISITRIADGLFVDVNEAFLAMFGFHRDEVVGRRSVDVGLLTAEERTRLIRAQLASGGLKNAELVTRTKDGRPLHLLFSSKAMTLGGEAHHVTTLIDVTERKLVELERQKFFLLAESSSEFIGMCDLDMRPLYVNPAGVRMVGLPDMEAACSVKVMDYFFPEDQGFIVDEFFPRVLREGHGDVEIRLRHFQTGEPIWMYYYLFSLRDSSGTAIGWATVSHEITARKRSEAERDLLQSQLSQAQKMESVGRLAGGVAHDFNNMLSVILGYSDLALQKLALSDPLREDLEEIRGAARRSADLTRQLFAFSRKQIVAPKVLNINDTIEAMTRLLGRLIGENIALSWQPGQNVWPVYVDPAQVDQILANLCVNSRDAISGVGNIIIESRNASFDDVYCAGHAGFLVGDFVCIAVTDNGSGMDAETQTHLFEPYFTTKGLGKGTGLGLASVYGAVTQNSGFIQVLSEEGNGTTVEIYLPRHSGEAVPNGGRRPTTSEPTLSATILLVEDEPLILGVARRMLEQLGYAVLSARTPGAAMQLAETYEGRIDLLLTDVVMPEMNGRDLADALQKSRPDLRQLFMSGYTTDVIVKQGVLDPGVNFIAKPFLQHELGAKVRDALEG